MSEVDFTKLMVVLAFLAGPTGAAAWAMFWSNLLRNLIHGSDQDLSPIGVFLVRTLKLREQPPEVRQFIHALGFFAVPLLAYAILENVPAETIMRFQETYAVLAMLFSIYIAGQFWYYLTKPHENPPLTTQVNVGLPGTPPSTEMNAVSATPLIDSLEQRFIKYDGEQFEPKPGSGPMGHAGAPFAPSFVVHTPDKRRIVAEVQRQLEIALARNLVRA